MTDAHRQPNHPCEDAAIDAPRRRVIRIAAAGFVAQWAGMPALADAGLAAGQLLVEADAEGAPKPLRAADLQPGKPVLAFPFDAKAGKVLNESRLQKVVLVRFDAADLPAAVKGRAAGGVLAYSAICTHQACDVKTWLSKEKVLVCFCHSSKFDLLDDAKVTSGPAPRPLPFLPLKLDGEQLVVAGPFSASVGGAG